MSTGTKDEVHPLNLERCARCGNDHRGLAFYPLHNPPPHITHWALCPKLGQPILMTIRDEGPIKGDGVAHPIAPERKEKEA